MNVYVGSEVYVLEEQRKTRVLISCCAGEIGNCHRPATWIES